MDALEFLQYMVTEEHNQIDKLLDRVADVDLILPISARDEDSVSIGERFVHMITAEYRMAGYLYQTDNNNRLEVNEKSVESIKRAAKLSQKRHLLTLQNLTSGDLNKEWESAKTGMRYSYKYILWHYIEHLATHRGQLAMSINAIKPDE